MPRREVEWVVKDGAGIDEMLTWLLDMVKRGLRRGPVAVRCGRPRRTLDQNAKMWPMIRDIIRTVPVYHGATMSEPDYRDLFTGSIRQQYPVPGLNGGVVFIGGGSSGLTVDEFSDLIEMMYAFGAEHGVAWSEPSQELIHSERARKRARQVRGESDE